MSYDSTNQTVEEKQRADEAARIRNTNTPQEPHNPNAVPKP